MGGQLKCNMHTRWDYRDGDGARSGVPGPGGSSNAAITTTSRTTTEMRSGSIMGIILSPTRRLLPASDPEDEIRNRHSVRLGVALEL
jgi:hypothetical protein